MHWTNAILTFEGVVLAGVILLWALTHLRDELIARGWIALDSWLARTASVAERAKLWQTLKAIGFREDHLQAVSRGLDTQGLPKKSREGDYLLSQHLLTELKKWTVRLDDGFSYKDSGEYYIDSMGAMSLASTSPTPLATLLGGWVLKLQDAKIIPSFDFVLVLKEGNVTLVRQFITYNSPEGKRTGILCKGENDRSRVRRTDATRPHDTDFEGLRTLLAQERATDFRMRAIAVDDNCTGGSSLCHAMHSFNELIKAKGYPINPVEHAVVLFAVKSQKTRGNFEGHSFQLHSVLSLGREEMVRLRADKKFSNVGPFKRGYGCESSITLRA
jgi:hypothetical protein